MFQIVHTLKIIAKSVVKIKKCIVVAGKMHILFYGAKLLLVEVCSLGGYLTKSKVF